LNGNWTTVGYRLEATMAEDFSIRALALSVGKPRDVDEKKNWPECTVLASSSSVELPGRPMPK
jgi:hypothetical protein